LVGRKKEIFLLRAYNISVSLLLRIFFFYIGVFLFCWLFLVTFWIAVCIYPCLYASVQVSNVLTLILALTWQLQGFLDALVFGFTNRQFRNRFKERYAIIEIILSPILLIPYFIAYIYRLLIDTVKKPEYMELETTEEFVLIQENK